MSRHDASANNKLPLVSYEPFVTTYPKKKKTKEESPRVLNLSCESVTESVPREFPRNENPREKNSCQAQNYSTYNKKTTPSVDG